MNILIKGNIRAIHRSLSSLAFIFLLITGLSSSETTAASGNEIQISVLNYTGDNTLLISATKGAIDSVIESPLFKNRQLPQFSIIIDGNWNGTSAYWSPTAIRFKPKAILQNPRLSSLLTHELTHHLHFRFRPHEESWVREGVALLSEYLVTGLLNPSLEQGFSEPETSLLNVADPRLPEQETNYLRSTQYGHVLQYFLFIYRLCGKDNLLDEIITSNSAETGIRFLDQLMTTRFAHLKGPQLCADFSSSFLAFERARFLQDLINPEKFVVFGSFRPATIRNQELNIPSYSATAYRPAEGKCRPEHVRIKDFCLKIRQE